MVEEYPKFNLEPFNNRDIFLYITDAIKNNEFDTSLSDVQGILKVLETRAYKIYTGYSSEEIRTLVTKYTFLFRALLIKKDELELTKRTETSYNTNLKYIVYRND